MKALRWIIILVNGLEVNGSDEIGFIGKLIEDKNLGISFEDLSYIDYFELSNTDNIFNIEMISGILTTTIPAPPDAIQSEERALYFIEDRYGALFENKEYEITFDYFDVNGTKGYVFYLSPHEPSITTRNMVQQVKGGQRKKLPAIERNQADVTSRIASLESPNEWNSFVDDIDQKVSDNTGNSSAPKETSKRNASTIYNKEKNVEEVQANPSEWNSFIEDIGPNVDEEEIPSSAATQRVSMNEKEENNNENKDEWNSFIEDIGPSENENEGEPSSVTQRVVMNENHQQNAKADKNEWSSFIEDIAPKTEETKSSSATQRVSLEENDVKDPSEWNSFIEDIGSEPKENAPTKERTKTYSFKKSSTEMEITPIQKDFGEESIKKMQTSYKNPPTRRLQIPQFSNSEELETKEELDSNPNEWNSFLDNLKEESDTASEDDEMRSSKIFTRSTAPLLDNNKSSMEDTAPRKTTNVEKLPFTREKKQSLSPTPVPFAGSTNKGSSITKTYAENYPKPGQRPPTVSVPKPNIPVNNDGGDVMFDDAPKKMVAEKVIEKKKSSLFKRLVYFVFFLIILGSAGFAYLWVNDRSTAEKILSEAEKIVAQIQEKLFQKEADAEQKLAFEKFKQSLENNNNYYDVLSKIDVFIKTNGNFISIQNLRKDYIAKTTEYLTKQIHQLESSFGFKTTEFILNKYNKIEELKPLCKDLTEKMNEYKSVVIEKTVNIAEKLAVNGQFQKALSLFNNPNKEFFNDMVEEIKNHKKDILKPFLQHHMSKKTYSKGIQQLLQFLNEDSEHEVLETELFLTKLIYAEVHGIASIYKYEDAIKKISEYNNVPKKVQNELYKMKKDIQLESEGWDLLCNGVKRLHQSAKEYSLKFMYKNKMQNVKGKVLFSSKTQRFGKMGIRIKRKSKVIPIADLSLDTLANFMKVGLFVNVSAEERYHRIGLFLFSQKRYNDAKEAFTKANKLDVWTNKMKFTASN